MILRPGVPGHKKDVLLALDYLKSRSDVDPSRIALMGFSRGGLLALMVGVERDDLKGLLLLAPAPGLGHFEAAVNEVPKLSASVLLLVDKNDSAPILRDFDLLELALKRHGKVRRAVKYSDGSGHRLFWSVGPWWKDVAEFLRWN